MVITNYPIGEATLCTSSKNLEALMLEDCPIKFFPTKQYNYGYLNTKSERISIFSELPSNELISYLDCIESKLNSQDIYLVTNSKNNIIRMRLFGKILGK